MSRLTGYGPVSFGAAAQTNLASYSLDIDYELEEKEDLATAFKKRIPVAAGWTASLEFEDVIVPRNLGSISAGTWTGIEVKEWSFKGECNVEECTAQDDDWKVFQCVNGDWSLDAEKWEATDSFAVFQALLLAQATALVAVDVICPYGKGKAWLQKNSVEASSGPMSEKITLQGAGLPAGTETDPLVSTNAWMSAIITQCEDSRTQGYATPYALVLPHGSGNCFVKSVELKSGKKLSASVELQGTGAFSAAI